MSWQLLVSMSNKKNSRFSNFFALTQLVGLFLLLRSLVQSLGVKARESFWTPTQLKCHTWSICCWLFSSHKSSPSFSGITATWFPLGLPLYFREIKIRVVVWISSNGGFYSVLARPGTGTKFSHDFVNRLKLFFGRRVVLYQLVTTPKCVFVRVFFSRGRLSQNYEICCRLTWQFFNSCKANNIFLRSRFGGSTLYLCGVRYAIQ